VIRTRKSAAAELDAIRAMITPLVINMTPTEGMTITLPASTQEIILNMDPATDLSLVTIALPANATPREGQRVFIGCTKSIDQVTATGPATVNAAVSMIAPGDNFVYLQNKGQTWSRLIG
jgi:uncharacterized protein (DUF849 family)